jgi:AcrR family transcriptional regulator
MSEAEVASEEIMDGVYRALCENGYAELTMQDIADECDKSTSLLHYHYDTKTDLLAAFLDGILAEYEERLACRADRPPAERLVEFVARFVFTPGEDERESFHLALLEMRSQGPFDDRIQAQLDRSDELLRERGAGIVPGGVAAGAFEPVDVDRTAALLVATLDGARTRQITLGDSGPATSYTEVVAEEGLDRVVDPLLADGVERPSLAEALEQLDE